MIKDFLNKDAIINCHKISLLPSLYFRYCNNKNNNIHINDENQRKIEISNDIATNSHIHLRYVCDTNGNNPLYLHFDFVCDRWKRQLARLQSKQGKFEFENMDINVIAKLYDSCPEWLYQINDDNIPISRIIVFDSEFTIHQHQMKQLATITKSNCFAHSHNGLHKKRIISLLKFNDKCVINLENGALILWVLVVPMI